MKSGSRINIVDEIKSRCNIVDVVGRVVPLKKAGNNYKGICPFHNEKTPSFVVSEEKQIYTCFGCGATGDVISFVERYYNTDFRGAVEMLAREYGISLEGAFRNDGERDALYEINRQAAVFFYRAMRQQANPGYTYMKKRGISEDILNKFGIGYADGEWTSLYDHLKKKDVPDGKMEELGLVSRSKGRYFDKFRNRVIFPIINTRGRVIGFGGRAVGDGEPKYLNSQESAAFQKKNNLYGLNLTKKDVSGEDRIVLVEGYMDAVSLYQSGIRNVAASLGTALTENQARLIKRYTKNVILSYDADKAGQTAAFRGVDVLYGEGCRPKVLKVTDGKDPDEFIKKKGKSAFLELMDEAASYGDFKIDFLRREYDLEDEQQRVDFVSRVVEEVLLKMKPVEADIYIKKLADATGISQGAIRFEYTGNNSQEKDAAARREKRQEGEQAEGEGISMVERDLISLMLKDDRFVHIPEDVEREAFRSRAARDIRRAIISEGEGSRPFDITLMAESLDEESAACLRSIEESMGRGSIPHGKEEKVFSECIEKVRGDMLKREEKEIITRLSMADEEENEQEIIRLTEALIDIQKKIRNKGGHTVNERG